MEGDLYEKHKDQSYNAKNRRSGEISNYLFETYKNSAMLHVKHLFKIAYEMSLEKMCAYSSS